ncbi:MAG TPA: hypothetical protein VGL23_02225 [Chloroflexota bacterium]
MPAVDQYLTGVSEFDAGLMWGALSAGEIKTREARGGSLAALQRELDEVKQRGVRYERAELLAAYPLRSGETYLFYALSRRGFAGPERLDRVSLVFTVDGSGKIADVSWNRPEDLRPPAYRR